MPWIERNIAYHHPLRLSAWRKLAIGTWRSAGDPSVYGVLELEAGPALAYIGNARDRSGKRVTMTHFLARAIGEAVRRHPEVNCVLRWGRLYPRKQIDVFVQVATDRAGRDLSGTVLRNVHLKSVVQLAEELESRVDSIRNQGDLDYARMKGLASVLPGWVSRYLLSFGEYFMYLFNLWTPLMGVPKDSFGSVMLTNIGSLGLDEAFAPLVPYSRVSLLIASGAVRSQPVVREGRVEVAPVIKLCATFDHRVIDGVHASNLVATLRSIFADPEGQLGPPHEVQFN